MPCGWARSAGLPCLTPVFFAYVEVAGALALVGGTAAYTTCFQTWRYRSIIGLSQVLLLFANLIDWIWTSRYNLAIGIPDELMAFGEEVFIDVIDQLNSQPFFIFAAKLCPPDVEASSTYCLLHADACSSLVLARPSFDDTVIPLCA